MSRRIVIIGGMGPQASLELHRRIIVDAAERGAKDNEDYPEVLHASIPITDFISSGDSTNGLRQLTKSLDDLQFRDDDKIIITCNTAHLLLPVLEARYGNKFVSLVSATTQEAQQNNLISVGILASPTTIKSKLYEEPLNNIGCKVFTPTDSEIESLEKVIRHIIANGSADAVKVLIEPIIDRMLANGAKKIILGCTELSVIFSSDNNPVLIDPLDTVLALL